jgi:hypothetical protein
VQCRALFRALWLSGSLYFVANAMQTMVAAWMVVELTGSSFLAALVQTAGLLPMFLLSLQAGVMADITDRRRQIPAALTLRAITGTVLAGLLFADICGPATLRLFIFVAGACTATMSLAWDSTVAESIPRDDLPNAITAVAVAYEGAHALRGAGGRGLHVGRRRLELRGGRARHAGHAAGHPALAAQAVPDVAPADRAAGVSEHRNGLSAASGPVESTVGGSWVGVR